jgi:uncharacterized membrane protein YfcA
MHDSTSMPCPRCGAALPVEPTAPAVTCGYCHLTMPVPQAIRDAAIAHAARMSAAGNRAAQAQSALGMYQASAAYSKGWWKIVAGMFGAMFLFSILGSTLGRYIDTRAFGTLIPFAMYGAMGYFGYRYYKAYQASKNRHAAPIASASTCGQCGGPLTFVEGNTRAVCKACHAVALAGKTLQLDLARMAEQRARGLDLERAKAERQMYRSMAPTQSFVRIYLIASLSLPVLGLTLIPLGVGTYDIVSAIFTRRAHDLREGIVLLAVGGIAAALAAAFAMLYYRFVYGPAHAAEAVLRRIAARLGGRVVRNGTGAALDWLDAHWRGPAPYEVMMPQQETVRLTLETAVGGAPALLVAVFAGASTTVAGKKLHVLVAAPTDGPRQAAPAVAHEISRFGFELALSEDGANLGRFGVGIDIMNEAALGWILTQAGAATRA